MGKTALSGLVRHWINSCSKTCSNRCRSLIFARTSASLPSARPCTSSHCYSPSAKRLSISAKVHPSSWARLMNKIRARVVFG